MYKKCVSKQAITRQREIEAGLLSYMSLKSYDNITVIDLCEKLNIPRKAFYRYFTNKDGALYALIDHTLIDAFVEFDDMQKQAAKRDEILIHFFIFWREKKPLLDALASNNMSGILLQRAISFILSEEAVSKMIYPLNTSIRAKKYRTVFLLSGLISLVIQWHINHFDKTPSQMAALASDLLP